MLMLMLTVEAVRSGYETKGQVYLHSEEGGGDGRNSEVSVPLNITWKLVFCLPEGSSLVSELHAHLDSSR